VAPASPSANVDGDAGEEAEEVEQRREVKAGEEALIRRTCACTKEKMARSRAHT